MEDYFSYDESSDSSEGGPEEVLVYHDYEASSLNDRIKNKQFETLKLLRHALSENKVLKQRINMIESQLEHSQSSSLSGLIRPKQEVMNRKKSVSIKVEISRRDEFCQTDFSQVEPSVKSPLPSDTELVTEIDSDLRVESVNEKSKSKQFLKTKTTYA